MHTFNASNVLSAPPPLKLLHKRAKSTRQYQSSQNNPNVTSTVWIFESTFNVEYVLSSTYQQIFHAPFLQQTKSLRIIFGNFYHNIWYLNNKKHLLLITQKSSAPNKTHVHKAASVFLWILHPSPLGLLILRRKKRYFAKVDAHKLQIRNGISILTLAKETKILFCVYWTQECSSNHIAARVWRTGTGNSRYRELLIFLWYRNRYRNKLVP